MVYHVVFHVASCSMEIHMVNHEVGMRCSWPTNVVLAAGQLASLAPSGTAPICTHNHPKTTVS